MTQLISVCYAWFNSLTEIETIHKVTSNLLLVVWQENKSLLFLMSLMHRLTQVLNTVILKHIRHETINSAGIQKCTRVHLTFERGLTGNLFNIPEKS